jgi:twitching motility protein PilT
MFPPHHQKQVRIQLASVLKAVISMRLIPKVNEKGRVPAVEILISTSFIQDCITNPEKTKLIKDSIAQGVSQYGMQTFDQSLYFLYQKGLISYDEALKWASNPDEFKLKKIGVRSTKEMSMEEMEKRMSDIGDDDDSDTGLNGGGDFADHNLLDIEGL